MIIIFDAGFFLAALLMVILGLLGMVEQAMPTITVIMWIVFGVSAIGCSCMAIGKEESLWKRIVNFVVNAIAHTYIGIEHIERIRFYWQPDCRWHRDVLRCRSSTVCCGHFNRFR